MMAIDWGNATTDELLRECAGWLSQMLNMICTTSLPAEPWAGSFYTHILHIPPTKRTSNDIREIVAGWKAADMRRFVAEFMGAGSETPALISGPANEIVTPIMHILDDRLVHEVIDGGRPTAE
jgi:hypothetical protein